MTRRLNFRERVVNSTRGTLEEVSLQGLLPGTRYGVRVVAHNEHGPGMSSAALEIITQSEVDVPGPPKGVNTRATSSFSILISWDTPAGSGGDVEKYKLYYRRVGFSPLYIGTYFINLVDLCQTRVLCFDSKYIGLHKKEIFTLYKNPSHSIAISEHNRRTGFECKIVTRYPDMITRNFETSTVQSDLI